MKIVLTARCYYCDRVRSIRDLEEAIVVSDAVERDEYSCLDYSDCLEAIEKIDHTDTTKELRIYLREVA